MKAAETEHEKLVAAAHDAIEKLFADTSVARAQTWSELDDLWNRVDQMLLELPSD